HAWPSILSPRETALLHSPAGSAAPARAPRGAGCARPPQLPDATAPPRSIDAAPRRLAAPRPDNPRLAPPRRSLTPCLSGSCVPSLVAVAALEFSIVYHE